MKIQGCQAFLALTMDLRQNFLALALKLKALQSEALILALVPKTLALTATEDLGLVVRLMSDTQQS